jgi:hypothetical protein
MVREAKTFPPGTMFGYWKVISPDPTTPGYSICLCTGCNQTTKSLRNYNLKTAVTRSCTCKHAALAAETTLLRYGAEHYSQTQECKDKVVQTSLERYGDTSFKKTEQGKQQYRKTCLEKYGTDNYRKSEQYKKQIKQLNLERYGTEYYTQTEEYRLKTVETSLKKYGVQHFSQSEQFKQEVKKTSLQRYGVEHYKQTEEARQRSRLSKRHRGESHVLTSSNMSIREYCVQRNISYTQALYIYREQGEEAFLAYCDNYSENIFSTELTLLNILKPIFPELEKYDRMPTEFKINRKPDFRLERNGKILYVNIDGLFTHSESSNGLPGKDNRYHFKLREDFEQNQSRIMQFRENELQKPNIIRSIVGAYFNLSTKIYARKCIIKKVSTSDAQSFFDLNHLMGFTPAPTFGLYHNNQLVCAISTKKKGDGLDIIRFCNALNIQVVGGLSKLLEYVKEFYRPNFIQSFVDLRYATGESYKKLDFTLSSITLGWSWTDFRETYNRLQCRANMDDRRLTQAEYAAEKSWVKIYDAGQAKWVKVLI